mmetsp:Transcript_9753/g.17594  ORF Transcript_9753/g.17594 Transcript_9753/m.17594 type:complete len:81 (+) Transcript_9753:164-406(+)
MPPHNVSVEAVLALFTLSRHPLLLETQATSAENLEPHMLKLTTCACPPRRNHDMPCSPETRALDEQVRKLTRLKTPLEGP